MLTELSSCRHIQPTIEPEPFDDEDGDGLITLDRWGDRAYCAWKDRFVNELIHASE